MRPSLLRTGTLAIVAAGGVVLARTGLGPADPWSAGALAIAAGLFASVLSTSRADGWSIPCGALAGLSLAALAPWHIPTAAVALAVTARIPQMLRAPTVRRAAVVLGLAAVGGVSAAALAELGPLTPGLQVAACALAGLSFILPSILREAAADALVVRRAARGLPRPERAVLGRAVRALELLASADSTLRALGSDVAAHLARDARALARHQATRRGGGPEGRIEARVRGLDQRMRRCSDALERAALLAEDASSDAGVAALRDLERENELAETVAAEVQAA